MNLSTDQQQIVEAQIGEPIQVLASAGSGKTRVLTERIRYILNNTPKGSVIGITFTNKAAEEMQTRLGDSDEITERTWISTIHSVAQRILEQYGHIIGLPSELQIHERDVDRMEVFMQSLRDDGIDIDEYLAVADQKKKRSRERNLQIYMERFSEIKRELLDESGVLESYPEIPKLWKIYQDYQEALLNSGGIDYDDLLLKAYEVLKQEKVGKIYRAKYKHVCVDEAQDLNKAQYELIKALCGDKIKSLMMVGDPNQMIYGFNGSKAAYLLENFISDFAPTTYCLKQNYRSTTSVIAAANKLRPGSQTEHEFALDGKLEVQPFENEENESEWIVAKIKQLVELKHDNEIEGEISLDKIVVLARNRFVFNQLEKALDESNVPYKLRKGERRTEATSIFGKVLDYGIRLKLNNRDWMDGKKLCALLGISLPSTWDSEGLLRELSTEVLNSSVFEADLQAELLTHIHYLELEEPNIPKFVRHFNSELESLAKTETDEEAKMEIARSIEELKSFKRDWTQFKAKGLGNSLQAFRNAIALGKLSDDQQSEGLMLSTVHTMKGLEKDIVFLMGMCEGVFPDYRATTSKDIEEELNSAFVAVTRAKRWLYITYPKQRKMPWGDYKFHAQSRFVTTILNQQ